MALWRAVLLSSVVALAACSGGRDKLIADLQSARPEERALAVKKLAEQGKDEDLTLFTQAAKDPVPIVRAEAMSALGTSHDARVVDLLGEGLSDGHELVQQRAAAALASLKTDKARAYLMLQFGRRGRATREIIVQALKGANVPGAMAGAVAAEAQAIWDRTLKTLQEGSLPERVGAAEELGKSGRPEAVTRLVPLLKDSQVLLAAAAVRGLGNANDKRAVAPIAALLKESYPDLREAACEALAQLGDPQALPALKEVAVERSPLSRQAAKAIVALPRSAEGDKALCEVVLQGGPAEAVIAGRALRKRDGCPLEPIVEKLRSPSTALAALPGLGGLGPRAKDAAPKVAALLTSADANVRRAAVEALVELGDVGQAPALLKAYEAERKALETQRADWIPGPLPKVYGKGFDPDAPADPNDPDAATHGKQLDLFRRVRALADAKAKAQGKVVREPEAPREVVDDASEDQLKVLAALVRAVGALGLENAQATLTPYLQESSPSLRASAIEGLAALGGDLSPLEPFLMESDREVQGRTARALAATGAAGQAMVLKAMSQLSGDRSRLLEAIRGATLTPAAADALIALVKEGGAEAGDAALALGELKHAAAVDVLVAYLAEPTSIARSEAITALGRLGVPKAADAVGKELYSDSADVRAAAVVALAALGPGPHADALDALKSDYYRRVREAAAGAQGPAGGEGPRP